MDYKIERIESSFLQANTYLIHYNNKTIIIDPCVGVEVLKRYNVKELIENNVINIVIKKDVTTLYNEFKKGMKQWLN